MVSDIFDYRPRGDGHPFRTYLNDGNDRIVRIEAAVLGIKPPPTVTTYTVQAGDTLGGIAKRFGVTVDQLVQWNGLANPDSIDVGQVLKVSDPGKG